MCIDRTTAGQQKVWGERIMVGGGNKKLEFGPSAERNCVVLSRVLNQDAKCARSLSSLTLTLTVLVSKKEAALIKSRFLLSAMAVLP